MATVIPYKFYKYQVNGKTYFEALPSYNTPDGYSEASPQEVQSEIQKYQNKNDSWSQNYINTLQKGLQNVQSGSSPYIVDAQGRFMTQKELDAENDLQSKIDAGEYVGNPQTGYVPKGTLSPEESNSAFQASQQQSGSNANQTMGGSQYSGYPTTNLTPGMSGDQVKQLQQFLINNGYDIPAGATGYYGEQTKAAVSKFQTDKGVDVAGNPGYWGPRTIGYLNQSQPAQPGQPGQPGQQPDTPPKYDTRNKEMNDMLDILNKRIDELSAAGKVVNPNIELTPMEVQKFLDQATTEIDPYYASLLGSIKDDLTKDLQLLQKEYDIQKKGAETGFKESLASTRESLAGRGLAFSGVRGQEEQSMADTQQRQLDLSALGMERGLGGSYRNLESQIGTSNLPSIPQFNASTVSTEGAGSFGTGRQLNFSPTGNIYGTIPAQRTTDIQRRKLELETTARQNRVLDLYNT